MTILRSNGSCGIGVTPTIDSSLAGLSIGGKVLHVHDTSGASLKLSDADSGANRGLGIASVGVEAAVVNCEAGDMRFGTGNSEKMRIDHSSGGLAINNTSAASLLEIKASALNRSNGIALRGSGANDVLYIYPSADNKATIEHLIDGTTDTGGVLSLNPQGGGVLGTHQILQFPPSVPIANSSGSNVTYYQNGALTSTDASLHNTPLAHALTVNEMRVYVNSALTGGGATVQVVKNATAITGTNKEIDVTTGTNAFHASTIATDFAVGDRIGIKIILEDGASAAWYHVTLLCTLTD
jgi:hypothetical protein